MAAATWILVLLACLVVAGVTAVEKEDEVAKTTQTEDDVDEVTPQDDRIKRQGFVRPNFNSFTGRQAFARQQTFGSIQQFPLTSAVQLRSRLGGSGVRGTQAVPFLNRFVAGRPRGSGFLPQPTFQRQIFQTPSPQQLTSPAPAQALASAQSTPVILNSDPLRLFSVSQTSPATATFGVRRDPTSTSQPASPVSFQGFQTSARGQQTPPSSPQTTNSLDQVSQGLQVGSQFRPNRQTFIRTQGQNFARQPQFQIFSTTPTPDRRQQPQVFRVARPQPQTFQRLPAQQSIQSAGSTFNRPLQTASQPFQLTPVSSTTPQPLLRPQVSGVQQPSVPVFQTPSVVANQRQTQGQLFPGGFRFVVDDTREDLDDTRELFFGGLAGGGVPRRVPATGPGRFTFVSDDTREIFDDSPELIIGSRVAANLAGAGVPGRRRGPVIRPGVQPGVFTFIRDDTREDLTRESVSLEVLLGGRGVRPSSLGGLPGGRSQQGFFTSFGRPSLGVDLDLTLEDFTDERSSREFFG